MVRLRPLVGDRVRRRQNAEILFRFVMDVVLR